jgi:hypothetical protein
MFPLFSPGLCASAVPMRNPRCSRRAYRHAPQHQPANFSVILSLNKLFVTRCKFTITACSSSISSPKGEIIEPTS